MGCGGIQGKDARRDVCWVTYGGSGGRSGSGGMRGGGNGVLCDEIQNCKVL